MAGAADDYSAVQGVGPLDPPAARLLFRSAAVAGVGRVRFVGTGEGGGPFGATTFLWVGAAAGVWRPVERSGRCNTTGSSAGAVLEESVFLEEGQVLVDEAHGHAGEEGELLPGELRGQEPYPVEAPEVAVHRCFGVVGAHRDVRGGQPLEVEADDGRLVSGEHAQVGQAAAQGQKLALVTEPDSDVADHAGGAAQQEAEIGL